MSQDGIGPAFCHFVYRGRHIDQSGNWSYRYSMVHGNDDGPVRLAIQDALQPDRLSDLAHVVRDVYSEIKDGGRMKEEENGMIGVDGTGL